MNIATSEIAEVVSKATGAEIGAGGQIGGVEPTPRLLAQNESSSLHSNRIEASRALVRALRADCHAASLIDLAARPARIEFSIRSSADEPNLSTAPERSHEI